MNLRDKRMTQQHYPSRDRTREAYEQPTRGPPPEATARSRSDMRNARWNDQAVRYFWFIRLKRAPG